MGDLMKVLWLPVGMRWYKRDMVARKKWWREDRLWGEHGLWVGDEGLWGGGDRGERHFQRQSLHVSNIY
jgi:hypothetical protein